MHIVDVILWTILFCLPIIGFVMIYFLIWRYRKYKVRIRKITQDRTIIEDDRARVISKKKGVKKLLLKNKQEFIPMPPSDALDVGSGLFRPYVIELYYLEEGGTYRWINIPHPSKGDAHPLNTEDREFYLNEMRDAEARKKTSIMQQLPAIMGFAFLIILFVLFVVFLGDIVAPIENIMEQSEKLATVNADLVEKFDNLLEQKQVLRGDEQILVSDTSLGGNST